MQQKVIIEKQDLTYLKWSHARNSSGTAGTFLKSQSLVSGEKIYYKLSNLDSEKGFTFFQNFLKDTGILEQLEALGIQDGDTVRMYGLSFDYYK